MCAEPTPVVSVCVRLHAEVSEGVVTVELYDGCDADPADWQIDTWSVGDEPEDLDHVLTDVLFRLDEWWQRITDERRHVDWDTEQ